MIGATALATGLYYSGKYAGLHIRRGWMRMRGCPEDVGSTPRRLFLLFFFVFLFLVFIYLFQFPMIFVPECHGTNYKLPLPGFYLLSIFSTLSTLTVFAGCPFPFVTIARAMIDLFIGTSTPDLHRAGTLLRRRC